MNPTKKKVWIFTFEFAGVIKVGGLGEVPANQAKHLAEQYEITVFMPAHGQLEKISSSNEIQKLSIQHQGTINFGISEDGGRIHYKIDFYLYRKNNINIILLSGNDNTTKKFIDDPTVYNPDTIKEKIALFSVGMRFLMNYYITKEPSALPEIIHLHDYHVVIPFFSMKQVLQNSNYYVPSIITIHLLTWPTFDIDYYKSCGIDDTPIGVRLKDGLRYLKIKEIFTLLREGINLPSVEKVGAFICDLVTSVSESYLNSHIIPNCGNDLIRFKSDFIWNGCDWDYEKLYPVVIRNHGDEIRDVLELSNNTTISKKNLKNYLLAYKLGNLSESPLISSSKVLKEINEISNGNPFVRNGRIKAFAASGPLVLTTGRISPQKGFETIFNAVPDVIKVIPDVKFLFLILPTDYSLREIKEYSNYVKLYPENIRIIFGVASDIFYLAHIASDAYCALSRWEPFGIMALEAMASKVPVIATKVGGLQETVIDIRKNSNEGTGILIEKDNVPEFTDALISLLISLKIASLDKNGKDPNSLKNYIDLVPDELIRNLLLKDHLLYFKIQDNCLRRVREHFTWEITSKKLIEVYSNLHHLYK